MSATLGLFRLQQVDRQIDRVRSQLDTIQKTLLPPAASVRLGAAAACVVCDLDT